MICREISLRHVEGFREPESHAVHNPHFIDPEIERRIARWIWKERRTGLGLPVSAYNDAHIKGWMVYLQMSMRGG